MRRERGLVDLWVVLIGAIAMLGLLVTGITVIRTTINEIDQKGYQRGVDETLGRILKRDNEQLAKANAEIQRLQNEARAKEAARVAEMDRIARERKKEIDDAKRQSERDAAAVRSGAIGLRDPGARAACGPAVGGVGLRPPAGAATAGGNGATGAELSREAAGFLLQLANEADDVARQLGRCQQVILKDRSQQ